MLGISLRMACTASVCAASVLGCSRHPDAAISGGSGTGAGFTATIRGSCEEAGDRLGFAPCYAWLDRGTWLDVRVPSVSPDRPYSAKFLVAKSHASRLATVFISSRYELHQHFLTRAFPQIFPDLTPGQYADLVLREESAEFYSGSIAEYRLNGTRVYGYHILRDASAGDAHDCAAFRLIQAELEQRFVFAHPLLVPATESERDAAASCAVGSFEPGTVTPYEVYSAGTGWGTLRRGTPGEDVPAGAGVSWQDILVLDRAPHDLPAVVSGLVSAATQTPLSHLNVRFIGRGTPSCYIRDAHRLLSSWEGALVKLTCTPATWSISAISQEEAWSGWNSIRPAAVMIPAPDLASDAILAVDDVDTSDATARHIAARRFGHKGANLATLYQRIGPANRQAAALVPFSAYAEFMDQNDWEAPTEEGPRILSFSESIETWLHSPSFGTQPALRAAYLGRLAKAMTKATVAPEWVQRIRLAEVGASGQANVMLRARSSSNTEDAAAFNGAGLHTSTRICLGDVPGASPNSMCDAAEESAPIEEALPKVWASLWSSAAYSEREWYGMDHKMVAMGIVLNPRIKNERADIVMTSGNPSDAGDRRFFVNAQIGGVGVVSPPPGVTPERVFLEMSDDGEVRKIFRVERSSLSLNDDILTNAELEYLGRALAAIRFAYPVDVGAMGEMLALLDTEWKQRNDGTFLIKQIRTLRSDSAGQPEPGADRRGRKRAPRRESQLVGAPGLIAPSIPASDP
ncbi:MAG: PEP/pyruvate-binding domain-containing protein [Nannocystaceae bacterium]